MKSSSELTTWLLNTGSGGLVYTNQSQPIIFKLTIPWNSGFRWVSLLFWNWKSSSLVSSCKPNGNLLSLLADTFKICRETIRQRLSGSSLTRLLCMLRTFNWYSYETSSGSPRSMLSSKMIFSSSLHSPILQETISMLFFEAFKSWRDLNEENTAASSSVSRFLWMSRILTFWNSPYSINLGKLSMSFWISLISLCVLYSTSWW